MKIGKLFHWLYLFVMALPLMVAPIFAIYSHRHIIDSYTVTEEVPSYKNFYQGVVNGKPYGVIRDDVVPNWDIGNLGFFYSNQGVLYTLTPVNNDNDLLIDCNISFNQNDVLYFKWFYDIGDIGYFDSFGIYISDEDATFTLTVTEDNFINNFRAVVSNDVVLDNIDIYYYTTDETSFSLGNIQLFNLTTIFGSGNEPTNEVFETFLMQDYYDYGDNQVQVGTEIVTYNDTDIGSQFIYDVYNVINKYFNYDRVFNFGDLYSWLNTTFFSGNAPLGFFIFWHLLIYWLLTSILWLIFDVLMYVPQLVHRWLDKASIS